MNGKQRALGLVLLGLLVLALVDVSEACKKCGIPNCKCAPSHPLIGGHGHGLGLGLGCGHEHGHAHGYGGGYETEHYPSKYPQPYPKLRPHYYPQPEPCPHPHPHPQPCPKPYLHPQIYYKPIWYPPQISHYPSHGGYYLGHAHHHHHGHHHHGGHYPAFNPHLCHLCGKHSYGSYGWSKKPSWKRCHCY